MAYAGRCPLKPPTRTAPAERSDPEQSAPKATPEKVLVVAPAWIGDMTMSQPLAAAFSQRGAEVHYLTPPATYGLAQRMPGVAALHLIRTRHGHIDLMERCRVALRMRRLGFGRAVILPRSFKAALVPALARIPRRTGYLAEGRGVLLNDARNLSALQTRTVDRLTALADTEAQTPRLIVDADALYQRIQTLRLSLGSAVVALCPGAAYGASKRWPEAYFATVAKACHKRGVAVWILGGKTEVAAGERIARCSSATSIAGRTSLPDVVDLLSAASAVVSNDSGLMHVAAAVGVPVVAVYGSTTPALTPPLAKRSYVLEESLACRPCFRRECPLGHLNCLRQIRPDRVLAALEALGVFGAGSKRGEPA